MAKKKGKYANVIGNLPKLPALIEPERRDAVEALKQIILEPPREDDPTQSPFKHWTDEAGENIDVIVLLAKRAAAGKARGSEFARIWAELRKVKDAIASWDSDIGLLIEAYVVLMVEHFQAEEIKSVTLANGQPVSTHEEPYSKVVDKEAFRLWCIQNGYEKQLSLHHQTMNAIAKERLLTGEEGPEGVETFALTKVRLGSE